MNSLKTICLSLLVLSSVSVQSVHAQRLANGSLGYALYYTVESPMILKVGENTSVVLLFSSSSKLYIKTLWVSIYGAEINSSIYGIGKLLVNDTELDPPVSFNETLVVRPLKEGTITCMISTTYNWTDTYLKTREEWSTNFVYAEAKANTYDELLASENTLKSIAYILSITTIAFIGATTYLKVRQTKTKKKE